MGSCKPKEACVSRYIGLLILCIACACPRANAGECVDPRTFTKAVIKVSHPAFDAHGSAWFISSHHQIVAVAHVVGMLGVLDDRWTKIKITRQAYEGGSWESLDTEAMVERVVRTRPMEDLYVLRVKDVFPEIMTLSVRKAPLKEGERVSGIGYTDGRLRFARGSFVRVGGEDDALFYFGLPLMEMAGGNDRHALSYGSSGGPVVDCAGYTIGGISSVFIPKEIFKNAFATNRKPRVDTPWGAPTLAISLFQALFRPSP